MATTVVGQRHLWLSLMALKECQKVVLLNAPVATTGLFSEAVEEVTLAFKKKTAKWGASQKHRARQQMLAATATAPAPKAGPSKAPQKKGHKRPAESGPRSGAQWKNKQT
ncbi:hypothetical protein DPEC_G00146970 [Dallia pectoralis]|uniref:Uncharacterized protein n=1 Tax=Dallia pectoralis TaxID=75939 RepID=A0ACC2GPU0_DALPE|nr:hypothetical protein DPEC_G00146970 [Dallia pectoralis]